MERIKQQNLLIGDLKVRKRIDSWAVGNFCAIIGKGIRRVFCNFGTIEKTLSLFYEKNWKETWNSYREWTERLRCYSNFDLKVTDTLAWQNIRKQRWNRKKRCKQQKHFQSLILKGNKWKFKIKNKWKIYV